MKLESFTKKIFKSSLISSIWVNLITLVTIFLVTNSLIFKVYNKQYNNSNDYITEYIDVVNDNEEFYKDISNYLKGSDKYTYSELETKVTSKTSRYRGISSYLQSSDIAPSTYLNPIELEILERSQGKNVKREIFYIHKSIYIVDIQRYETLNYFYFFNLTNCKSLPRLFINEGFLGYSFGDIYNPIGIDDIPDSEKGFFFNFIKPENLIIDSNSNYYDIKYHISSYPQFSDNLTIFFTILALSILRIFVTLVNSKRNINKIYKPLNELVKNTEKLASHEVCEKLNRFDYPYMEFKKLAEAFNKVLLSRELSEIKLFRSFEQMESVVHKRTQELITANDQLTKAITKAEEANEAKSQFLANISHEIRTPLNCIIGFCDIILTDSDNEEIKNQIGQILHESETLLHLINDFLDYSKIDAGKMTFVDNELNIRSLISSLLKSGQVQAGDKPISLVKNIDSSVPPIIISDELRLYQVISNVFYNAIKFTEVGSVTINVTTEVKGGETALKIEIEDTGIGIPDNRIDSIFNKFEQVDGSLTRNYRGSGLGLTICKKIVELLKGTISVTSKVGLGSTFKIMIPVKTQEVNLDIQVNKKPKIEEKVEQEDGSQILLVEDYPVNQIVAKKHLEMDNHLVTVVENGLEAVKICNKKKFDLILMDLQMPVMDGFKATKEIRAQLINRKTPILAMTANAMDTAKQTCMDTGMNGVITKPIRKQVFLKEVKGWLSNRVKEEITPL